MTVLTKKQILHRIFDEKNSKKRLVITPIADVKEQIGNGTIDIRLGTRFIIFRRRKIEVLDPLDEKFHEKIREIQEKIYVPYGNRLILHPNELILGSSLEYLRFPPDIMGYVVGRSSWGRLGLIIETSPVVHPCFIGVLTFELSNLSTAPIPLYPGTRIAQISLHKLEKRYSEGCREMLRKSKYVLSTSPEFSQICKDEDLKKIKK